MNDQIDSLFHPPDLSFRGFGKMNPYGQVIATGYPDNLFDGLLKYRMIILFRNSETDGKIVRTYENSIQSRYRQ